MFCVFSARGIVFFLLLGSLFILASCDEDDDEVGSEQETVEVDETSMEKPESDECLNADKNTKTKCCNDFNIDDHVIKCVLMNQKKMPKENEQNPKLLIKFISCLTECIYKARKYMGKGDSLNMKVIKADAKKKYKDDTKMQDHMIEMYSYCQRNAAGEWNKMKASPAGKIIFTGSCKPFYMFVFICEIDYNSKVKCPYFVWKGKKSSGKNTIAECEELRSKCEELHN